MTLEQLKILYLDIRNNQDQIIERTKILQERIKIWATVEPALNLLGMITPPKSVIDTNRALAISEIVLQRAGAEILDEVLSAGEAVSLQIVPGEPTP